MILQSLFAYMVITSLVDAQSQYYDLAYDGAYTVWPHLGVLKLGCGSLWDLVQLKTYALVANTDPRHQRASDWGVRARGHPL